MQPPGPTDPLRVHNRLPHGVRDYLPEAAARRRAIASAILDELERWGYRRIVTPAFEYEAVLGRGLGPEARAQSVRFVEPGTGEVVILRPDLTPQIARVLATRRDLFFGPSSGPARLAYEGAVVRLSHGGARELFQAGVELAGAPAPAGDVEVVALAAAALEAAGIETYTIDLGEASLVRAALAGLEPDQAARLKTAIGRKDRDEVGELSAGLSLPAWRKRLLHELPSLYGGLEVIELAGRLLADAGEDDGATAARDGLTMLARVFDGLGQASPRLVPRLSLDLGEVRGFDYYTGLRFQGFAPDVGDALLSGGRYDRLAERYGGRAVAAGFAVDVERVAMALPERAPERAGVYLAGDARERSRVASSLRRRGLRVTEELDAVSSRGALAARANESGSAHLLVLDGAGGAELVDLSAAPAPAGGDDPRPGAALDAAALASLTDGDRPLDALFAPRYGSAPQRPADAPPAKAPQAPDDRGPR